VTVRHEFVVAGFSAALWTAVGFSVLGVLAALLTGRRATAHESQRAGDLVLR
jgi:hypothetical protein